MKKSLIFAFSFLFLVSNLFSESSSKYKFTFPSYSSRGYRVEKRQIYATEDTGFSELRAYVKELLLGPEKYRSRPLFTLGTSLEFCTVQKDCAFIGLSEELLSCENNAVDITEGFEFLRKNILDNFASSGIKKVEIFVNCRETYPWDI